MVLAALLIAGLGREIRLDSRDQVSVTGGGLLQTAGRGGGGGNRCGPSKRRYRRAEDRRKPGGGGHGLWAPDPGAGEFGIPRWMGCAR